MHTVASSVAGALIGTGLYLATYGPFRAERLKGVAVMCAGALLLASALACWPHRLRAAPTKHERGIISSWHNPSRTTMNLDYPAAKL